MCVCVCADAKHKAESELTPQTRPRSNTLPKSFGSTLEQPTAESLAEREGEGLGYRPTHEETLQLIEQHLRTKREEDGWPEDIRVSIAVAIPLICFDSSSSFQLCPLTVLAVL